MLPPTPHPYPLPWLCLPGLLGPEDITPPRGSIKLQQPCFLSTCSGQSCAYTSPGRSQLVYFNPRMDESLGEVTCLGHTTGR